MMANDYWYEEELDELGDGWIDLTYRDLNGKPVKRNKADYPYSYDDFVTWMGDYNKGKGDCVYSDRLWQWNSKKFDSCCMEVWGNKGQTFYGRNPKEVETFLCKYFGKQVKLTVIMEGCNHSSGYPIWTFFFEETNSEE